MEVRALTVAHVSSQSMLIMLRWAVEETHTLSQTKFTREITNSIVNPEGSSRVRPEARVRSESVPSSEMVPQGTSFPNREY
jgi:hypothetical protein